MPDMVHQKSFTLIELLVVIGIIALLSALLLGPIHRARETARQVSCASNLQQINKCLQVYADDFNDRYPLAWMDQLWEQTCDGSGWLDKMGWMRRIFEYIKDKKVYKCPSFARRSDEFNYFLGVRAGYALRRQQGYVIDDSRVPLRRGWVEYPSVHVLGGDCNRIYFNPTDCDRDDYTQPCLGWKDVAANDSNFWAPWHHNGLNVMFVDGHVNWFDHHVPNLMTYSYKDYTNWENALPDPPWYGNL
jgi:prepilin-type N-terminal cleavage/methylation domain-containing protein/prepilin-type processing-associated H-X9-DG protein